MPARGRGDLLQRSLVDLYRYILVLHAESGLERIRRHAFRSDSDRIDTHAERLGDLGGGNRSDLAGVVRTIGQKDDHLRLSVAVLDTAHGIRQAQPDSRSVLDHTALDILEEIQQDRMIGCQRALRKALGRKDHETDVIVRTAVDERRGHILRRLQAVRFQVLRQHTTRDIHRQHDIDTFRGRIGPTIRGLRTGQDHDQQRYRYHTQHERHVTQVHDP